MVRAWAIWTLVVVGCRPPDGGLVASCAVADDNALRVWCEVDGGEDVVVRYQPVDGGAETVQRGVGTPPRPATEHWPDIANAPDQGIRSSRRIILAPGR